MEKISDEQLKREMTFDLYGRYASMRNIIDVNRKENQKFRVLDVGGRGNLMKLFLPEDDVFYLDPLVDTKDSNYIEGDGCAIPLEDESFDWVVSADVFEHISEEKREDFLEENVRVAKLGILLAAPFDSPEVRQAEYNANENFKILSGGKDHIWLKEHIANGLPGEKQIEEFIKAKGFDFHKFHNRGLFLWENLQSISCFLENNLYGDLKKEINDFNFFYNSEVFPYDTIQPSYRKIYFVKKDKELKSIEVAGKPINDLLFLNTIKKAMDLVCKVDIENKKIIQQKDEKFNRTVQQKDIEIRKREQELHEIRSSLRWKIPNYFYKIYKRRVKKYIPKFFFNALNHAKSFSNKKEEEAQKSNEKYINKVLSMRIADAKDIKFEIYPKPRVSIVVLAYNKWQFTYNCLKSVKENTKGVEYEVIVIDNASSDNTNALFKKVKNVKYIRNNENRGFSKACNQGAKEAKGEYILFLNNDIVAKGGWLAPMVDELDKNEKASIVGSKLLYPNGTIQHAGVGFEENKIPVHLYRKGNSKDQRTCERKLYDAVTAACALIRKKDFFEAGGFDENYINGLEDVDLCLKIRDMGKDIVFRPDSVLYHFESMSEGRFDYAQKNVEFFLGKWGNKISSEKRKFIE